HVRPARKQRLGPDRCAVDHDAGDNLRADRADHALHRSTDGLMPRSSLPVLGLMLGDCAGIGPEQCARILGDGRVKDAARLVVVGDARVLEMGARDAGVDLRWRSYATPEAVDWARAEVPLIDLANLDPARITRGQVSAESGRLTGETLAHMIE